jgi:hypothetical protein
VMLGGMLVIMSGRAPVTVTSTKQARLEREPAVAR